MSALASFLRTLVNKFLVGILAILPLYIVVQIFIWLVNFVLRTVFNVQERLGGYYWLTVTVFVAVFLLLTFIGHEITKRRRSLIISVFDLVIRRVPLLNTVYRVTQKAIDMFRGQGGARAREVVYVEYPKDGVWLPAYVTNREGDRYVLYIPTSPNPTNGFTVIVHESKIVRSELAFDEVMSFVMSVGADFPRSQETLKLPR